jgi:hypothetical protein
MKKLLLLLLLISNFLYSENIALNYKFLNKETIKKEPNNSITTSEIITVNTVSDLSTIGTNITTAIVLGYHEKNDGGGGIFVYDPNRVTENDEGLIFNGWERSLTDSDINIKWFGAISTKQNITDYDNNSQIFTAYQNISNIQTKNDLVNNNTLAFQRAIDAFIDKKYRHHLLPGNSNRLGLSSIFIPSGDYLLKENILNIQYPNLNSRTSGIRFFSDGQAVLVFVHSGDGKYGFNNIDAGLKLMFSNITFIGLEASCDLFYSESNGGAQDYYFENCNFLGKFNKVFTLKGTNNNSEWGFLKCSFEGKVNTILDISGSNISDQFVNYWFDQTKFWISEGTIINADKGGHFKFNNCDWSGYTPPQETYYFKLNASSSARGVNDFRIINGRFEMKNSNARVLKSNWQHGNIEITADFGSQAAPPPQFAGINMKHFEFNLQGASNLSFNSLNVNFRNSIMMGFHEFNYGNNAWRGTGRVSYENCSFPYRDSLDDFIKINHNGNNNKTGIANIEIKDAIFENNAETSPLTTTDPYNLDSSGNPLYPNHYNLEIPSVSYLPSFSNRGLKRKYFKIAHPARGENPLEDEKIILNFPIESEAIITSVKWFLLNQRLGSTRVVEFALSNLNGDIIISKIDPVQMRFGFDKKDEIYINIKDLEEGKLVLKDLRRSANQVANEFLCVIEYF